MRTSGFTLIELLVVIAIIAILAAILLPIFAAAIRAGKESHCVNNLTQVGRAFEMYRNDWEDYYPVAHNLHNAAAVNDTGTYVGYWEPLTPHQSSPAQPYWFETLLPYVKNKDIFKCPLDKGQAESAAAGSMFDYWGGTTGTAGLAGPPWNRPREDMNEDGAPDNTNPKAPTMSTSYIWNGALGWRSLYQKLPNTTDWTQWRPNGGGAGAVDPYCNYVPGDASPKHQGMIKRPAVRFLAWDAYGGWHKIKRVSEGGTSKKVPAGWTVLYTDTHTKYIDALKFDELGFAAAEDDKESWWMPPEADIAP